MSPRALVTALGVALLAVAGCQRPAAPPIAALSTADSASVAERARFALAERDCGRAAPLLRQAVQQNPGDVGLHYDLGVCATYLDARDEAIVAFEWVLENASAQSAEAQASRTWLVEAGILEGTAPAASGAPAVERSGDATLNGRAVWSAAGEAARPKSGILLYLRGLPGTPAQGVFREARTDDDGRFSFTDIAAGDYKLTDRVAGHALWRLKVHVEPARETTVALSPTNGVSVHDDFPGPVR